MSLVSVFNEWDPLEEVIVGRAIDAFMPQDKSFTAMREASPDLFEQLKPGKMPDKIIEETEEDIQNFIDALIKLNITVKRPTPQKRLKFKTPNWEAENFFCYCPRDILLAISNIIIETPNVLRSRYFETENYKEILIDYLKSGSRWIAAPKPKLQDHLYDFSRAPSHSLGNHEPVFDAANILRAGRDLFYLVSDSGNELGLYWLQQLLGDQFTIHACHNLYASMHIDSTLALLRPGLVLINPDRVSGTNLPNALRQWDQIKAPEMTEYRYSDLGYFSTKWLGMNLLMLNPELAVVDQHQRLLIRLLEKNRIQVLPLLLRHGRTLGGGFHCITLDVRRKGNLENYFS